MHLPSQLSLSLSLSLYHVVVRILNVLDDTYLSMQSNNEWLISLSTRSTGNTVPSILSFACNLTHLLELTHSPHSSPKHAGCSCLFLLIISRWRNGTAAATSTSTADHCGTISSCHELSCVIAPMSRSRYDGCPLYRPLLCPWLRAQTTHKDSRLQCKVLKFEKLLAHCIETFKIPDTERIIQGPYRCSFSIDALSQVFIRVS